MLFSAKSDIINGNIKFNIKFRVKSILFMFVLSTIVLKYSNIVVDALLYYSNK